MRWVLTSLHGHILTYGKLTMKQSNSSGRLIHLRLRHKTWSLTSYAACFVQGTASGILSDHGGSPQMARLPGPPMSGFVRSLRGDVVMQVQALSFESSSASVCTATPSTGRAAAYHVQHTARCQHLQTAH